MTTLSPAWRRVCQPDLALAFVHGGFLSLGLLSGARRTLFPRSEFPSMESTAANPPQKSTTAKAVFESIFRYQSRLLGTFAAIMVLVGLYAVFAPRQYESGMTILVRNARPEYQITPERTNVSSQQAEVTEERINSEIEVLHSRDVLDRVVDPSWNSDNARQHTAAEIKVHEKTVLKLAKNLKVELQRKSDVIHVAYSAHSPQEATATVERLLAAFLTKQRELERSSGATAFFASEQTRYKHDLDDAQSHLAAFQQTHDLVSLPDKEAALEQQIVDLQTQLRATDVLVGELRHRLGTGSRQIQTLERRQITQQRTVPNILAMEQLGTMLATYQNQRTALLTKFPPTDRLVLEIDQQIANTTEALRQARDVNAAENATDVNPAWQQVSTSLAQNTVDLSAATARRDSLKRQLADLQHTLSRTEDATVEFTTLQARVTELQGDYQLYSQKRTEAQMSNAMDQEQLVNVAVAERPTFSPTPSSPKIGMTLGMGAFAALFFAACAIFFAEMGRDTIAAPFELEAISQAPVLATVPLLASSVAGTAPNGPHQGHAAPRSPRRPPRAEGMPPPLTAQRAAQNPDATGPEAKPGSNSGASGSLHLPQEGIA